MLAILVKYLYLVWISLLMNLLNAIAVDNISKMMKDSEVECMSSNIAENNDAMKKHDETLLQTIIFTAFDYIYYAVRFVFHLPSILCDPKACINKFNNRHEKDSSGKSPSDVRIMFNRIDTGTAKFVFPEFPDSYWKTKEKDDRVRVFRGVGEWKR